MRSSYKKDDVILLLKDITGLVEPQPTKERERLIQSGKHARYRQMNFLQSGRKTRVLL